MKKRFSAAFLALALCLGLAVPAFAADSGSAPQYDLNFGTPDGQAPDQKTAAYRVKEYHTEGSNIVYGDPESTGDVTTWILPLGASITVGGLESTSGVLLDVVAFNAWSDPDGDGIYEQRLFRNDGSASTVVPLTEKGPFVMDSDTIYGAAITAQVLGFTATADSSGYVSVTLSTDRLCEIFGANTILDISVRNALDQSVKASAYILLTGKASASFTDVPAWCADAVAWAKGKGITDGTTPTSFSPNVDCTHIQILTMLWRAADKPGSTATAFSGLAGDYAPAANWAYEKKMIDDSFDPNAKCTRSDAVSYIWQAFKTPEAKASSFTDVDAGAAYAPAVDWAYENGVTDGTDPGVFSPGSVCSRGQIVTFLHRAYVEEARLTTE